MAFRLLHTADWQIGMKAAAVGAAAARVRAARLEAARRVIELANERRVDAVVLAGDTFEDTTVAPALVQQIVDILRHSEAPVFVLPGNHDPLVPGGVFDHAAWRDAAPRVTVLREPGPIALGDADLFACPLRERHSMDDPLETLPDAPAAGPPRARLRIAIAHGTLRGGPIPDDEAADDFPIDLAHARRAGLDWLALGHFHAPSSREIDGVVRAAYCGSHEPTKFGESNAHGASGQCLIVTLDRPGAPPHVEAVRTASLEWRQSGPRELRDAADVERLRAAIDAEPAASRERVLIDLRLEGALTTAERAALEPLRVLAEQRFLHARLRTDRLATRPDGAEWIEQLPAGAPQAAARALLAEAGASVSADATAARAAEVAQRALEILFELHAAGGDGTSR